MSDTKHEPGPWHVRHPNPASPHPMTARVTSDDGHDMFALIANGRNMDGGMAILRYYGANSPNLVMYKPYKVTYIMGYG